MDLQDLQEEVKPQRLYIAVSIRGASSCGAVDAANASPFIIFSRTRTRTRTRSRARTRFSL